MSIAAIRVGCQQETGMHAGGLQGPGEIRFAASAEECLAVMDRKNIRTMVNLTGGYGGNL
jgi:hypothetical protein